MSTTAPARPIGDAEVAEFVRALDDAPDVPCAYHEAPEVQCPNTAEWAARCGRCNIEIRVCTPHRMAADHLHHVGGEVGCGGRPGRPCGWRFPNPISWRPL